MQAFSNQTRGHHFDAHGREVPPGRIIGIDRKLPKEEQPLEAPVSITADQGSDPVGNSGEKSQGGPNDRQPDAKQKKG